MTTFDPNVTYRATPSLPAEFYRIGSDGSVWSCQKKGMGAGKVGSWRRRKDSPVGKGYRGVRLSWGGRVRAFYIHRLVLEAFVGPCPDGMECCHGDGNRANNAITNLRWGTRASNVADKFTHGTQPMGSQIPWSVLTEADIPDIRLRAGRGESASGIAKRFKVDPTTITDVVVRRTWKHVA